MRKTMQKEGAVSAESKIRYVVVFVVVHKLINKPATLVVTQTNTSSSSIRNAKSFIRCRKFAHNKRTHFCNCAQARNNVPHCSRWWCRSLCCVLWFVIPSWASLAWRFPHSTIHSIYWRRRAQRCTNCCVITVSDDGYGECVWLRVVAVAEQLWQTITNPRIGCDSTWCLMTRELSVC